MEWQSSAGGTFPPMAWRTDLAVPYIINSEQSGKDSRIEEFSRGNHYVKMGKDGDRRSVASDSAQVDG